MAVKNLCLFVLRKRRRRAIRYRDSVTLTHVTHKDRHKPQTQKWFVIINATTVIVTPIKAAAAAAALAAVIRGLLHLVYLFYWVV